MQTILLAGAGKSSNYLIHYLLTNAARSKWKIIVADTNISAINQKIGDNPCAEAAELDINDEANRGRLVLSADIVLSLMPAHLHILLAKDCLKYKKHLITSSYVSDEMRALDAEARAAGLMFMCEMGLDPGIDHMSASKAIHSIHRVLGVITSFKSYCGGLIAPVSDDNPWHYKFTWNPRNVVIAGSAGAKYLQSGRSVEIPYERMFEKNKKIKVEEYGQYAWYPNRDSYHYLDLYDVPKVKTFMRATLRHPSFTMGWGALVSLGLTRQDNEMVTENMSIQTWVRRVTNCPDGKPLMEHVARLLQITQNDKIMHMLHWLGLFDEKPLKPGRNCNADILLSILVDKWEMNPMDKDLVIMQHEIEYDHKGEKIIFNSTMMLEGENREFSAMAKTVGLPIGILAKMILTNKVVPPVGVCIPTMQSIYRPLLVELAHHGVVFKDEVVI